MNENRNGATPAWLTFTFDGGGEETFHHTFNVKHPETWNWTLNLNQLLAGREVRFTATATDEETHAYGMARTCDLKVTVRDDDDGTTTHSFSFTLG